MSANTSEKNSSKPLDECSSAGSSDFTFQFGFQEDRNRLNRRTMEDAHHIEPNYGGINGQGFFAVYDGHAGRQAARWCGDNVHKILSRLLAENPNGNIPELLNATFEQSDRDLDSKNIRAGCTAVVTFLHADNDRRVLYTANVGDARAVLCRKGHAIRLTYDHKGSDPFEAKRIVDAGGFINHNRVNGVLAVTRSLGDASMKGLVIGNPYTTELDLSVDDEFLILACDGVWDVMSDQEAVNLLLNVTDTQRAAEMLVNQALEDMSTDNLSAIVIRFHHPKRRPSRATSEEIVFDGDVTPTPTSAGRTSKVFEASLEMALEDAHQKQAAT